MDRECSSAPTGNFSQLPSPVCDPEIATNSEKYEHTKAVQDSFLAQISMLERVPFDASEGVINSDDDSDEEPI